MDGESILNETVSDFAGFISKQQKNDLDEQITFDIIRIDDNLAIAWAPINFITKVNSVIAELTLISWLDLTACGKFNI